MFTRHVRPKTLFDKLTFYFECVTFGELIYNLKNTAPVINFQCYVGQDLSS